MPEALTRIPTHAAMIVDGNRRWAKNRGLPASFGHKAGFDRLKEITRYAVGDCGIKVLSLYVFSTENFARDAKEVGYLMDLFAKNFRTIAEEMNERDCQVLFSGRREGLQQRVHAVLDRHGLEYDLTWTLGGQPFLTTPGELVQAVQQAIRAETGLETELSTTGGTSDGRFIAQICPQVIELGPPNASIHKIDENVRLVDIEPLKNIYRRTLEHLNALAGA